MRTPSVSRRTFVAAAGLVAAGVGFAGWRRRQRQPLFLSAHHDPSERPHVGAFDARGRLRFRLPIDLRAHAAVAHPVRRNVAVIIARRPGNLLYEIDLDRGRDPAGCA